jgi:putative aldouronate transport system permease protein
MVYPFLSILGVSVAAPDEALRMGLRILPREMTLGAYEQVIKGGLIGPAYVNTIIRTVLGTVTNTLASFSVAFVLSKRDLPGKGKLTLFFVFTMYFSGGMIPSYLLMKDLHLINTRAALIVPGIYGVWNIVMIRNYLATIPADLTEAAVIDGAGAYTIMTRIIFPLAGPILATVAMWNGVGNWNAWFDAMIYITDQKKQVLQVILRRITIMEEARKMMPELNTMFEGGATFTDLTIKAATIILTIGPIILVYPFIQKYYIKGIVAGSLKG